jgi:hypothetical protein
VTSTGPAVRTNVLAVDVKLRPDTAQRNARLFDSRLTLLRGRNGSGGARRAQPVISFVVDPTNPSALTHAFDMKEDAHLTYPAHPSVFVMRVSVCYAPGRTSNAPGRSRIAATKSRACQRPEEATRRGRASGPPAARRRGRRVSARGVSTQSGEGRKDAHRCPRGIARRGESGRDAECGEKGDV